MVIPAGQLLVQIKTVDGVGSGLDSDLLQGVDGSLYALKSELGGGGTVTSVDASGGTTGLTFSGGPITSSGSITLAGTLAIANGGTGATDAASALTALGAYAASNPSGYTANAGTVTSVGVDGGTTGLTFTGGPITSSGSVTMGGTLALANGGTGATTAADARTNLGLGTMAVEAAGDYLPLTGGTLTGTLLGTKIGLGTTPGTYQYLHIAQSVSAVARPLAILEDTSAGAGSRDILELRTAAAAAAFKFTNDTSYWRLLIGSNEQFRFDSQITTGVLNLMKDGKVGINDTTPAEALSVTGNIAATGSFKVGTTQVIAGQGAAVADATDAASAITQLNALLARMRAHGLIAT